MKTMMNWKMMNRRTLALALGGLALFGGAVLAPSVRAQDAVTTEPTKPISLNLHNVPIQTALQLLFTGAGIRNTSIDSDVQGFANITVNEVPFSLALRTLLNSVNPPLTYDVENGVYHVKVQRAVTPPAPAVVVPVIAGTDNGGAGNTAADGQKRFYRIPIDKYDAYYIARLLGAQGIIQVGANDVNQGGGGGGNNNNNGNNNRGGFGGGSFGGGSGFGGSSFGGSSSGFGGSGPNITSVGGGSTGGFGGGSFGGGGSRYGRGY